MDSPTLTIGNETIKRGETKRFHLSMPPLYTDIEMGIPVYVKRGKQAGPTLFVSAAIHGDELNGIEIAGRLIRNRAINRLKGTLIVVPMVNVYGVLNQSRYLPDRRDLNRSFPGSKKGSLAGRIANLFLEEIIKKADVGLDLHTGAIHRSNLPQIRGNLDDPETLEIAKAFGLPVLLNSDLRDGSLREVAASHGVKTLIYEAGQALRYDEFSIQSGLKGIINVMRHIGMLAPSKRKTNKVIPVVARQSGWVRAHESGLISYCASLGAHVKKGDCLARINNPFGDELGHLTSPAEGIIVGKQNIPLAQEGEALFNIAYFQQPGEVAESVERLQENLEPNEQNIGQE